MLRELSSDEVRVPGDAAELAAMLADAAKTGTAVWPRGAGTAFSDGAARRPGWIVSLERLDAIVDHQPDDLTITAQAGVTLGAVQDRLATARQHLPLRAAGGRAATLGGLLATHRPGLTRLGHGPLRDRVLGMTVALSSGELARSGGRVVKNVAGYDLHRLHVGARGTLGVIVEVTLKVLPLPAGRTLLMAPLPGVEAAGPLARALVRTPLLPVAVLVSELIAGHGPGGEDLRQPWLWIAYEDVDAGRERAVRDTRELARTHGVAELARHEGAEVPQQLADLAGDALLKLVVPGSRAARVAESARGTGALVADLGEGIVHVELSGTAEDVAGAALSRAGRARELDGWAELVRAPASVRERVASKRAPVDGAGRRMEALRAALDPAGVMSPGTLLEAVL